MSSKLVLNEIEQKVINLLKKTADYVEKTKSLTSLEVRLAGGWVRDKLLGCQSNDIDVTLKDISGQDFALAIVEFVRSQEATTLVPADSVLGKLVTNPEQSQHLETATMGLYGLDIDFVSLRAETYPDSSRIPVVTPGTVLTDALRRDFTVNSLFYNVRTDEIEDITGRGLKDLASRSLVTPVDAVASFIDDPLRILRGIRFASRFNFTLHDTFFNAIRHPKVLDVFFIKLSKERIGEELSKMLNSTNPEVAVGMLYDTGIAALILDEFTPEQYKQVQRALVAARQAVNYFSDASTQPSPLSSTGDFVVWLFATLVPWRNEKMLEKKKEVYVPTKTSRDRLKLPNPVVIPLSQSFAFAKSFDKLAHQPESLSRVTIGNFIREVGSNWHVALACAYVWSAVERSDEPMHKTFENFETLLQRVYDYNLQDAYSWKPILNGKQITQQLHVKPGPDVKSAIEKVLEWQFEHPGGEVDDCIRELSQMSVKDKN
ncbi:ATP(CTP) tRNA nucleotidyltransferase [Schizosaccharomyces japonicus yFS275]|uniref:ATP(CTP) tRNA nucleotidyltransferase n=1 Tax=Schizosaccharomyces japonicus (strain yFS275 / FY16936) TaxID=402676 RepID=B6JYN9_SCHJY|nr:ATP(CTP) tRNA nucleotidyltransferase [Schizosaccharomyces japonicus yFS275]EEB06657.1 ATP(CTP) tRNA nucleotidyltransferase [Schizosaccharomyces japonicus yFS275]